MLGFSSPLCVTIVVGDIVVADLISREPGSVLWPGAVRGDPWWWRSGLRAASITHNGGARL